MSHYSDGARRVGGALREELLTRTNVTVVGLLAVVGVLGLIGGFAPAAEDEPPRLSLPAGPVDVGDAEITVTGVTDGVLSGEILVTGERSIESTDAQNYFSAPGLEPFGVFLDRPGAWQPVYSPGVATPFEITLPEPAGEITLNSQVYRESNLDGSMRYFDRTPVAVVELP